MVQAFTEGAQAAGNEVDEFMHLHPAIAPFKAAVLPLSKKLGDRATGIYHDLQKKFMSKKVLIISSSLRADSNSDALAQAFAEGARTAGSEVELVRLAGKTLGFCRGCLACQKTGRCVIRDDGDVIAQKMLRADVLVFATPVYYYGMPSC